MPGVLLAVRRVGRPRRVADRRARAPAVDSARFASATASAVPRRLDLLERETPWAAGERAREIRHSSGLVPHRTALAAIVV